MHINRHGATFHFNSLGLPVTWGLVSIYGGGYGIAHWAAETWHHGHCWPRRSSARPGQFIVKLDSMLSVVRQELWLDYLHYGEAVGQQWPDDSNWLTQWQTHPFAVPVTVQHIVTEALREALRRAGVFVSRELWTARYPERARSDAEFRQVLDQHFGRETTS